MSGSSLTNTQLRRILRQISEQVNGSIEPQYIASIDHLDFEIFVSKFGSLAQACLEAGCGYEVETPDPSIYAAGTGNAEQRQQLIDDLRYIVLNEGLRPSVENYNSYARDRYDETDPLFGSWAAAVLEAGLDATEIPGYVSPQNVVAELQRMADQIGAPPSHKFAITYSDIEPEVYDSHFPTWDVAIQSAELDPEQIDRSREYITELEILAAELGHRPNKTEVEHYLDRRTYFNLLGQFGSVEDAIAIADVPSNRDLTPAGSLTVPADGNAAIPSHTDLLRDIFTVKRRYQAAKKNLEDPEQQRKAFEDRGIIDEEHFDAQFGSLEDAFAYAAQLDARKFRPHRREIPDDPPEILREHAVELAEILERRPLIDEVVALTDHTLEQYLDAFDSWDAVFDDDSGSTRFEKTSVLTITNTELIESIEQVGGSIGRPPTVEDYRELGAYPVETVLRRYGSWPAALRVVGVEVDTDIPEEYLATDLTGETIRRAATLCEKRFDHEAVLIDDLYRLTGDLGRIPDWDAVENFGAWSLNTYKTTFKDPAETIPESGVDTRAAEFLDSGRMRSQLVTDLKMVAEMADEAVWPRDIAFFCRYSIPSYLAVFGTLQAAFAEADLKENHLPRPVASWDKAWDPIFGDARAFLEALREEFKEIGEAPTMVEIREAGTSAQQCYEYYDSWRDALLAAGIPPNKRSPRTSGTKEELIEELQRLAGELGYPPKTTDIDEHGKFGLSSYYKYYSNWQNALADAGLTTGDSSATAERGDETAESGSTSDIVNQLLDDIEDTFDNQN
jgi:hypothetical protein